MEEKSTNEVEKILEDMKPDQLDRFYKENSKSMIDEKKAFYYYMKDIIDNKKMLFKDIFIQAGISDSYGEKIIRMEKHTKNRDLIIRICIAAHLSLTETNKALKLYGMNSLYAKDRRDACLIVAINQKKYDITIVNDMLQEHGFDTLN